MYLSVENPFITFLAHRHLDVSGVTGGNLGLCHQEGGSNVSIQKWLEPFVFLCLCTILGKDFHVACVWSSTVACL